jgi:ABC-2 type transport system permease protein
MSALLRLSVAELRLRSRDTGTVFFMAAFPLLLLVLNAGGGDRPERYLPGYIAMIIATGGLGALPGIVASYRERKVLRRLATTPVAPSTLLAAQLVAQVAAAAAGSALLVGVGALAYGMGLPAHPGQLLLAFVASALAMCALGFLTAAVAPTARAAEAIGLVVFFPMLFLSGAAVPRGALARTLAHLGARTPLGYAVTVLDQGWSGALHAFPLLVLAAIIVAAAALAARLFRWG